MFFFLSKTVNHLVMPLTFVFILLLTSAFVRSARWRKWTFRAGLILLFIFSNEFLANELMKAWEVDAIPFDKMHKYKVGIVLTGAMMHEMKPGDRAYFGKGADRVVHTVQLYKLGLIEKILVSGGSGRIVDIGEREADSFRDVMVMLGVPDSVIIIENQSRNTYESAEAVGKMLDERGYAAHECLLITSAFHMRRSRACFNKVGLALDTFSVDFYAHQSAYYPDAFLIPKVEALVLWNKLVKEWVGLFAYWIAGRV